jgi:hypothetical protein
MLNQQQVSDMLGIPESTLSTWQKLDLGPPTFRVGELHFYRKSTVAAWIRDGGALEYGICLHPPGVGAGHHLEESGAIEPPAEGLSAACM